MNIERIVALDDDQNYLNILGGFANIMETSFTGYLSYQELDVSALQGSDLLILDIYMPDNDALDVLMDIAKHNFRSHLAFMSGADDEIVKSVTSLAKQLKLNTVGSIAKPVKFSDFHKLINSAKNAAHELPPIDYLNYSVPFAEKFDQLTVEDWFNSGLVYPVFQPQYHNKSKKMAGIECLTRVSHPDVGAISPMEFIEYLESKGRMEEYTLCLVDDALDKVQDVLSGNKEISCSFNISGQSMTKAMADGLVSLFQKKAVNPEQIILEITESKALNIDSEGLYAISRLKVFGVKLSIDDFGTGYSSIGQLAELPFDEIKIDRSFVANMQESDKALAIVKATFHLAESLEFKLVVEGVETFPQLSILNGIGDCLIQGYLFSKPVIYSELKKLTLE